MLLYLRYSKYLLASQFKHARMQYKTTLEHVYVFVCQIIVFTFS